MTLRPIVFALVAAAPTAVFAEITVEDAYARVSRPGAPNGAAFMTILNDGDEPVQLVAAESDVAARVELHTHIDAGDGVMKMRKVEGGFSVPAGGSHELARGGDHVMFMGLERTLETGDTVTVTLTFEGADPLTIDIPVDNERMDMHGGGMGHGTGMGSN